MDKHITIMLYRIDLYLNDTNKIQYDTHQLKGPPPEEYSGHGDSDTCKCNQAPCIAGPNARARYFNKPTA